MSNIQHEFTLNGVTAIAFYKSRKGTSFVLVGEGNYLKVFQVETFTLAAQCQIFRAQTIHGITVIDPGNDDDKVKSTLWGGESFVLLSTEDLEAIVAGDLDSIIAYETSASDWILDGTISPTQNSNLCIFVTAHSAVLRASKNGSRGKPSLSSSQSQSRSVLYSAHAVWLSSNSILVAGGTVFGEIEVTIWREMTDGLSFHSHPIQIFNGHEGSVFGVRISPAISSQDGNSIRYLASCSDDRTIRVWELPISMEDRYILDLKLERSSESRETGFGGHDSGFMKKDSTQTCLAVVMAHASRIWRVDFVVWESTLKGGVPKLHLLSFGEDSTCQQWSIGFLIRSEQETELSHGAATLENAHSPRFPAVLTHLKTFSYHSGKNIWAAAISYVNETSRQLVTGGADGKLAIYDVFLETSAEFSSLILHSTDQKNSPRQNLPAASRSWTLENISHMINIANRSSFEASLQTKDHLKVPQPSTTMAKNKKFGGKDKKKLQAGKDMPNRYGFVGENELLATTSLGKILFASISAGCKWEELDLPDEVRNNLNSYSLLLGVPHFAIALLAGANGSVYIYHKKVVIELAKLKGKPAALFSVSSEHDKLLNVLVTTLGSDIAYQISVTKSSQESHELDSLKMIKLPSSFIVTGAGEINGLMILGARNGSMAAYDLKSSREAIKVILVREAHADDAITTIIAIPPPMSQESAAHFLTTKRNGSYSVFHLLITPGSENVSINVSIQQVHQAFPPLGPMIEAAWFDMSDLILYGFRSKEFITWNETKQREIMSVECGGAHRSYAYMPSIGAEGAGNFAYTKASKINVHSQVHPSHRVLKSGGHGREIKAAAIHGGFIATGAEDTMIRIWRIHRDGCHGQRALVNVDGENGKHGNISIECCAVLEKHTTGIQHLQWSCATEEYHSLFSAGGTEEFHVWAVSNIPGFGAGVICEATLSDFSEDRDLRIMGFDIEFIPDRRPQILKHGESPILLGKNEIILIYSDSTIKFYEYSKSGGFHRLADGVYTSACLTQVAFIHEGRGLRKFFTAATDGYLALWECPSRIIRPHEASGISPLPISTSARPNLELKLVLRLKLHQSSISALAIQHLTLISETGGLLVATAGDDNALCITFFHNFSPKRRITIPSAHAAGITGLAFKSDVTGGTAENKWYQIWTVGGDQRVKRWTVEFGHKEESPKPTMQNGMNMRVWTQEDGDDVWCSVPDPGGLAQWRDNWDEDCVLIYGNGMEVFKLDDGFPNGDGMRWVGFIDKEPKQIWSEDEDCNTN